MSYLLYIYLALAIFSAAAFIWGSSKYIKPHKPLYASMIVLGIGCMMLGRLYSFFRVLTGLGITGIFHVGMLGKVGVFMFFFSSNYGQVDSLVDGGEKEFAKYRLIALSGIGITAALYMLILFTPAPDIEKIMDGIVALSIAAASYFHVKHIFIPDIDYGVVRCLRSYNVIALLYGILSMVEMYAFAAEIKWLIITTCILDCIIPLLMVYALNRGVKKWST